MVGWEGSELQGVEAPSAPGLITHLVEAQAQAGQHGGCRHREHNGGQAEGGAAHAGAAGEQGANHAGQAGKDVDRVLKVLAGSSRAWHVADE